LDARQLYRLANARAPGHPPRTDTNMPLASSRLQQTPTLSLSPSRLLGWYSVFYFFLIFLIFFQAAEPFGCQKQKAASRSPSPAAGSNTKTESCCSSAAALLQAGSVAVRSLRQKSPATEQRHSQSLCCSSVAAVADRLCCSAKPSPKPRATEQRHSHSHFHGRRQTKLLVYEARV
jgi:hypothetical protein